MNTKIYTQQIESIVSAINLTSLNTYKVYDDEEYVRNQMPYTSFNEDFKSFGSNVSIDENQQRTNLIQALTNTIYSRFYCGITPKNVTNKIPVKSEREAFMETLSQANTSKDGLDYNWTIYNIEASGNAFVKKNDELRWLQPNGYYFADPNQKQPQLNTRVNLIKIREKKDIQPVFYHVFSNEMFPQEVELSRIYWNVTPKGAPVLIKEITTILNEYKIPFQFKCLNHPELYVRTDAAVLYLDKKHVQIVSMLLQSIIENIKPYLVDSIPMFTKKLFTGVGYAEDPGKGQSFGMSRSTVIAEAIFSTFEKKATKKEKLETVINTLSRKGMSLDTLHLNKHTSLTPTFPEYE